MANPYEVYTKAQEQYDNLTDDDVQDIRELIERTIRDNERRANQYLNLIMRRSTKEESDRFKDSYTHT